MRTSLIAVLGVLVGCGGHVRGPSGDPGDPTSHGATTGGGAGGDQPSTAITEPPTGRAGGGTLPASGKECWSSQLPAEVQPYLPRSTTRDSCTSAESSGWFSATMYTTTATHDARSEIVGRWATCSGETQGLDPLVAGIEFGANGRWQFLTRTTDAETVVATFPRSRGRYYMMDIGQLDWTIDGEAARMTNRVSHGRDGDTIQMTRVGGDFELAGIFGRLTPSPLNGRDNLPPLLSGACSLAGQWDVESVDDAMGAKPDPRGTFAFDDQGNFVGGPPGTDLCAMHTMYGTYALSQGLFEITSNVGMGECGWNLDAGYTAKFSDDCSRVSLSPTFDNCTLGRGYFNHPTVLAKRPVALP